MKFKLKNIIKGLLVAIIIIFLWFLLLSLSCKPEIEVLPIGDEAYPIRQLENGNYEVTQGYVIKHTAMMAEIKILKAKLDECRGDK